MLYSVAGHAACLDSAKRNTTTETWGGAWFAWTQPCWRATWGQREVLQLLGLGVEQNPAPLKPSTCTDVSKPKEKEKRGKNELRVVWETASQQGENRCIQPPGLQIPWASRAEMSPMRYPPGLSFVSMSVGAGRFSLGYIPYWTLFLQGYEALIFQGRLFIFVRGLQVFVPFYPDLCTSTLVHRVPPTQVKQNICYFHLWSSIQGLFGKKYITINKVDSSPHHVTSQNPQLPLERCNSYKNCHPPDIPVNSLYISQAKLHSISNE